MKYISYIYTCILLVINNAYLVQHSSRLILCDIGIVLLPLSPSLSMDQYILYPLRISLSFRPPQIKFSICVIAPPPPLFPEAKYFQTLYFLNYQYFSVDEAFQK